MRDLKDSNIGQIMNIKSLQRVIYKYLKMFFFLSLKKIAQMFFITLSCSVSVQ